jgi:hypothetical protein
MTEILIKIGGYVWLGYFVALCCFLFLALKRIEINSSLIIMAVTAVVTGLTYQYAPFLLSIKEPEWKTLVRVSWYLGFVVLDGLIIFTGYKIHSVFKINYSFAAKMMMLSFFVKAMLHLTRLTERYFWDTDYLKPLYKWGIVSINITTTIMVLSIASVAIFYHYSGKSIKSEIWKI